MLTQVLILSESQARDIVDFPNHAVISIISPGHEHPPLNAKHLLQVHFHDADKMFELQDGRIIMPISESIAEEIARFVIDHQDEERWIVHCEAGISRSPGVGLAIAAWFENHELLERLEVNFPCYNRLVRRSIENALHLADSRV